MYEAYSKNLSLVFYLGNIRQKTDLTMFLGITGNFIHIGKKYT